ncbi:MAG: ribosome small subunit-dependent GTPase A [Gammaproteobacteria bacterium]|nr:ribosome small subunit-dependent GTPase A [Gammaproteobacteria bacterium]
MTNIYTLPQLGWQPFFQQQLTLDEWQLFTIARIVALERSEIHVLTIHGKKSLSITPDMPAMTVGDWLLLDSTGKYQRTLERLSLFSRKAAGTKVKTQLIAANIDTVFVVCSLNQDFNLNRIERYLVLANEAGVEPVVVLTKADCCDTPQDYVQRVQEANPLLEVVSVNSLDAASVSKLEAWCATGKTVALLGSSGVGKSTLINTLSGKTVQRTHSIREDDDKGRHTTTGRSLHLLPAGGLLLDTPGMRELQLADCEHGVEETFTEISQLARQCKFTDCQHQSEPGCAIRAAIDAGSIDERRLSSYLKLVREQAFNTATLAEKRARDRDLGRYYRSVLAGKQLQNKE